MPANVVEYIMKLSTKQTKANLKKLAKELKGTQKDLKKTGDTGKSSMSKIGESAKAAGVKLASMAKGLGAVGAAAIAASGAVFSLSKKLADNVNELVDASNRTGIAAKSLAGLRLAAEGSGKSFASMERGLDQFVPKINEAAEGTGKSAEVFEKLGVQLRKTDGSLRSSNDIFNDTLQRLSQMEKGVERNAAVFDLFGRSAGGALIQSGAIDNLDKFIDRAEELGVSLDENGIQKAAEFQMGWAELKTSILGSLEEVLGALTGEASLGESLSSLATLVKEFAESLSSLLSSLRIGFDNLVQSIAPTGGELRKIISLSTEALSLMAKIPVSNVFGSKYKQGLTPDTFGSLPDLIPKTSGTQNQDLEDYRSYISSIAGQIRHGKQSLERMQKILDEAIMLQAEKNDLKSGRIIRELQKILNQRKKADREERERKEKEIAEAKRANEREEKELERRAKKRRSLIDGLTKEEQKEREEELQNYKDWMNKSIELRKQYEAQAREIDFSILEKLNKDFLDISKKIREGDITDYTKSDLALLKTQFEDIGLDTTNIDALNSKLQELEQNAKRLENIEFGLNITTDIIGLASGDIAGSISSMLTSAIERMDTGKAAIPIIGKIGGIVNSLASFGSALRDAEEKAIAEEEKKLGRLLLPDEEKAVADKARREMVEQRVQEFALAIQIAMEMLPSLLLEVLPPLLWELATRIVTGLINAILGIPKALWNMLKDWLPDWMVGDDKRSGGRYLSARSGIRFTGARDALTQLHRNEFVISESGARPQGIERILQGQSGSGIVININSEVVERSAIDELVRKIERRFQAFGSSQSSLFAG